MGRDRALVHFGRGVVDRGNYEVVGLGIVLSRRPIISICRGRMLRKGAITLPLLFSTHIAFFFWSMQREPARVGVIVEGRIYRKPGPSLSGRGGLEGIGKTSGDTTSPGRTMVRVAICLCFNCSEYQS